MPVAVHRVPGIASTSSCCGLALVKPSLSAWLVDKSDRPLGDTGWGKGAPMDSTVMPKTTEADDALAARADERLAHAYEQIARADEQLARLNEQMARMEQDAAPHPSVIPLPLRRPSRGRPALRGLLGLFAAACIVGAAFVSQSSYGEAARPIIAQWVPPYIASVSPLALTPKPSAQPGPSGIRLAAAEAAPLQAAPQAATGSQDTASPTAALTPPELTQLLQRMARDLATLQQGVDELKANQERMASDNAKAVDQVKASQEQMTRLVAKISEKPSEQEQRARLAAPLPQPTANPARKPVPAQASSQARAQPLQLQPPPR